MGMHCSSDNTVSSEGEDAERAPKVRKAYRVSKPRERWTDGEHLLFLEALKLHGRQWRKIEEHIGSKTAVQIRSHAQKCFARWEKGKVEEYEQVDVPPPRPKRKPQKGLGHATTALSPVAAPRLPQPPRLDLPQTAGDALLPSPDMLRQQATMQQQAQQLQQQALMYQLPSLQMQSQQLPQLPPLPLLPALAASMAHHQEQPSRPSPCQPDQQQEALLQKQQHGAEHAADQVPPPQQHLQQDESQQQLQHHEEQQQQKVRQYNTKQEQHCQPLPLEQLAFLPSMLQLPPGFSESLAAHIARSINANMAQWAKAQAAHELRNSLSAEEGCGSGNDGCGSGSGNNASGSRSGNNVAGSNACGSGSGNNNEHHKGSLGSDSGGGSGGGSRGDGNSGSGRLNNAGSVEARSSDHGHSRVHSYSVHPDRATLEAMAATAANAAATAATAMILAASEAMQARLQDEGAAAGANALCLPSLEELLHSSTQQFTHQRQQEQLAQRQQQVQHEAQRSPPEPRRLHGQHATHEVLPNPAQQQQQAQQADAALQHQSSVRSPAASAKPSSAAAAAVLGSTGHVLVPMCEALQQQGSRCPSDGGRGGCGHVPMHRRMAPPPRAVDAAAAAALAGRSKGQAGAEGSLMTSVQKGSCLQMPAGQQGKVAGAGASIASPGMQQLGTSGQQAKITDGDGGASDRGGTGLGSRTARCSALHGDFPAQFDAGRGGLGSQVLQGSPQQHQQKGNATRLDAQGTVAASAAETAEEAAATTLNRGEHELSGGGQTSRRSISVSEVPMIYNDDGKESDLLGNYSETSKRRTGSPIARPARHSCSHPDADTVPVFRSASSCLLAQKSSLLAPVGSNPVSLPGLQTVPMGASRSLNQGTRCRLHQAGDHAAVEANDKAWRSGLYGQSPACQDDQLAQQGGALLQQQQQQHFVAARSVERAYTCDTLMGLSEEQLNQYMTEGSAASFGDLADPLAGFEDDRACGGWQQHGSVAQPSATAQQQADDTRGLGNVSVGSLPACNSTGGSGGSTGPITSALPLLPPHDTQQQLVQEQAPVGSAQGTERTGVGPSPYTGLNWAPSTHQASAFAAAAAFGFGFGSSTLESAWPPAGSTLMETDMGKGAAGVVKRSSGIPCKKRGVRKPKPLAGHRCAAEGLSQQQSSSSFLDALLDNAAAVMPPQSVLPTAQLQSAQDVVQQAPNAQTCSQHAHMQHSSQQQQRQSAEATARALVYAVADQSGLRAAWGIAASGAPGWPNMRQPQQGVQHQQQRQHLAKRARLADASLDDSLCAFEFIDSAQQLQHNVRSGGQSQPDRVVSTDVADLHAAWAPRQQVPCQASMHEQARLIFNAPPAQQQHAASNKRSQAQLYGSDVPQHGLPARALEGAQAGIADILRPIASQLPASLAVKGASSKGVLACGHSGPSAGSGSDEGSNEPTDAVMLQQ